MNIGDTIRQIRKRNYLSQKQLANKIGVKRSTISMWENNKRTPNVSALASIFKLSKADINNNSINVEVKKIKIDENTLVDIKGIIDGVVFIDSYTDIEDIKKKVYETIETGLECTNLENDLSFIINFIDNKDNIRFIISIYNTCRAKRFNVHKIRSQLNDFIYDFNNNFDIINDMYQSYCIQIADMHEVCIISNEETKNLSYKIIKKEYD